jgi:TPR repeat protein
MSAMERTTYRRSLGSSARAFDEPPRDPQHAPYTSGPSTDFSSDDSIPLFLSELQGQADPREFAPFAASQRTSILTRVVAGGLVVSAFAMLVAVLNSDVTRVLIDKARASMGSATRDQSATQAASNQPASVNTPSREDIVSAYRTALQSQAPAARTGNEAAAPSKTLDAETLAALMTRAKSLLALGDIAAARLLLERAADAQDASAAFLLAQTYDPAVLGVRDTRSITADPVMARDWYRKAASFGSADAQQRLTQLQN